jgi:hypothetical protein
MEIIKGNFGSPEEEKEMSVVDKIDMALSNIGVTGDTKANFIVMIDEGDSEFNIASDLPLADITYLLEVAKLNVIMGQ